MSQRRPDYDAYRAREKARDCDTSNERIDRMSEECAPAIEECSGPELSEEDKRWQLRRSSDQADLVAWILHYKNPADDEAKLRQIRLVMK